MFYSQPKTSVAEETARQIVEMIRNGRYSSGDQLPGERQLSKDLQVGRTSVREAIRRLEAMGLVEVQQGRGTFVNDPSNRTLQTTLTPHILTNQQKLDELFELRQIVETAAAARAAERANASQIEAMRYWAQTIETAVARQEAAMIVTADIEFHRQIILASGNNTLVDLMDSIVDLLRDMRHDSTLIPNLLPEIVRGHREILTAVENKNSLAAADAMRRHLTDVAGRVKEFWQTQVAE
ncbi:MAG: FadR family transcriptional regulator [Anaerolineales bacterium]|nr:FadR family transcriptional regulator [Anaerolineales bacterium]